MKRTFLFGWFLLSFCFALSSVAQYRGGPAGNRGGGFGRPTAPVGSVGRAPIVAPFGRSLPAPGGFGGSVYSRSYRGSRGRWNGYGAGIGAYPVFIGGFSGGYYPGYSEPNLAPPAPEYAPAPPAPPVVINQYFTGPPGSPDAPPADDEHVQIYSQSNQQPQRATPAEAEPRSYLIAYKDHSVYSALAYWVEDHTLHYVTTQNTHNQADLSLIDMDFTKKLNQGRNMPFSTAAVQQ